MFEFLKSLDHSVFFAINGMHSHVTDTLMTAFSNRFLWVPFYVWLLWLVSKEIKGSNLILLVCIVALMITCSDQISVWFKNELMRLRPCQNPDLVSKIHLVGSCGGKYGFFSSHASNTFALAVFLILLLRNKISFLNFVLIPWAIIVCYSRVYLGVHYPADVFAGALLGVILGFCFERLYKFLVSTFFPVN